MLNDPRIAERDAGGPHLVLDKHDPAFPVQQGVRFAETRLTRPIFWCVVASVSVCIVMLIIDLA